MDIANFGTTIYGSMYVGWLENDSIRERISCRWHNYRMAVEFSSSSIFDYFKFIFLTYYAL